MASKMDITEEERKQLPPSLLEAIERARTRRPPPNAIVIGPKMNLDFAPGYTLLTI